MAILIYVGRYVLALIWVCMYITIPAMVFYDNSAVLLLISTLFSLFCLFPFGRHKLHTGREVKYRWADLRSEINPLYAAGYFRKSASDKNVLSNLKGKFYCEVLQLGRMSAYSEENMQILNGFFSDFWKKNPMLGQNKIKLIAILCIENENRELRKRLLSYGHVDQKDGEQGRYRLPVIVLHSDEPQLQILPLYSKRRGAKQYDEMKKEICTLLDLAENRPEE